jgi:hypothetical protein
LIYFDRLYRYTILKGFILFYILLIGIDLYGTYYDNHRIGIFSTPALDISLIAFYSFNRKPTIWQKRDYCMIGLLIFNFLANLFYQFKANKIAHLFAIFMSISMLGAFVFFLWLERDRFGRIKIGRDLLTLMPFVVIFLFGFIALVLPFFPIHIRISAVLAIIFTMVIMIIAISRKTNLASYYLIILSLLLLVLGGIISTFGMYLTIIPHRDMYPRLCISVAMLFVTNGILASFRPMPQTKSQ